MPDSVKRFWKRLDKRYAIVIAVFVVLVAAVGGYGMYRYNVLSDQFKIARQEFASTTAAFEEKVADLETRLAQALDEGARLGSDLEAERGKNEQLGIQIQDVGNTVTTLQKLNTIDPQLIQKYSKVFFLNENYVPATLTDITASEYVYPNDKTIQIHTSVWPYLQKLLAAASANGKSLRVLSAFRSFGEQSTLKASYRVVYGTGANQFSADQGYSEHQLGTTVDFTVPSNGSVLDKFGSSAGYTWLLNNAYKYGFTLSYPEGNAYYEFEPWHWRFVGVKLATRLFDDKQHFYDLDQRILDQYRITIFD